MMSFMSHTAALCLRCGRPANHPERLYLDCLHPVAPAPHHTRRSVYANRVDRSRLLNRILNALQR